MRNPAEVIAPARLGHGFRWLLASTWASSLGDGFYLAAGPLLVASRTHDPVLVSLSALLQWSPGLILGLYSGALVDRLDRRRLVLAMDTAQVIVVAFLAAGIVVGFASLPVVLTCLFLVGVVDTFVTNASSAIVPMLVAPNDLGAANARFTFGSIGLGQLSGPALGAALFGLGQELPFVSVTVCAVAGVALFARVRVPPPPAPQAGRGRRPGLGVQVVEGLRWTADNAAVRTLVIQVATFNVTYGASWSVLVLYAHDRLGVGALGFGLLTTAIATGGVLGTLSYGWLERHVSLADIMRWGLALETATHGALALTRSLAVAIMILFFFGFHEACWGTTSSSVRQRAVPHDLQGRVGSVYRLALRGGLVVGGALGGWLAHRWGITSPYWFGFAGSALILALTWRQIGHVAHQTHPTLASG